LPRLLTAMRAHPLQRVLFVDDDEVVQHLVRLSLERLGGLTVELVSDSSKTIDAAGRFKPDMIVLDWFMPQMDGTVLFNKLREVPALAAVPVVFLTVKAHWRTRDELLELGAAGVITKPFSARDLAAQLKAIWASLPGDPGSN
jgi:two-component system OmpR family response regulator